jgi:hypothetical protein
MHILEGLIRANMVDTTKGNFRGEDSPHGNFRGDPRDVKIGMQDGMTGATPSSRN